MQINFYGAAAGRGKVNPDSTELNTNSPTHPVLAAQGDTAAGLCPSPAWELINYVSS